MGPEEAYFSTLVVVWLSIFWFLSGLSGFSNFDQLIFVFLYFFGCLSGFSGVFVGLLLSELVHFGLAQLSAVPVISEQLSCG